MLTIIFIIACIFVTYMVVLEVKQYTNHKDVFTKKDVRLMRRDIIIVFCLWLYLIIKIL